MMYYDFEAGNKAYKLRLNTRALVELEKRIGCNPLNILGDTLPTVSEMVAVLHASLQQYQHGITLNDAYDILDAYLETNTIENFVFVILEVYAASGLIDKDKLEEVKNSVSGEEVKN